MWVPLPVDDPDPFSSPFSRKVTKIAVTTIAILALTRLSLRAIIDRHHDLAVRKDQAYEEQTGFHLRLGCIDQIFMLHQLRLRHVYSQLMNVLYRYIHKKTASSETGLECGEER